jgi:hypothetical protein
MSDWPFLSILRSIPTIHILSCPRQCLFGRQLLRRAVWQQRPQCVYVRITSIRPRRHLAPTEWVDDVRAWTAATPRLSRLSSEVHAPREIV